MRFLVLGEDKTQNERGQQGSLLGTFHASHYYTQVGYLSGSLLLQTVPATQQVALRTPAPPYRDAQHVLPFAQHVVIGGESTPRTIGAAHPVV